MNKEQKTLEFLDQLPEVSAVLEYGSGYFEQNGADPNEKKTMDLIISVENPNSWHAYNFAKNRNMYIDTGANVLALIDNKLPDETFSFPKSVGCFFTEYEGIEYKCLVTDKRLLYHDLQNWNYFSLAGRLQKETKIIKDNTNGALEEVMRKNYQKGQLAARLMIAEDAYTLLTNLVRLSYLGDIRVLAHCENKEKIRNIVIGSYEFLKSHYAEDLLEDEWGTDIEMADIEQLPTPLKNYIKSSLTDKQLLDKAKVSRAIKKYFKKTNRRNSIKLALRCYQTVGATKTLETLAGKINKGFLSPVQKKLRKVKSFIEK